MSIVVIRRLLVGICVAGIAGMIVTSIADSPGGALTFGLLTANAATPAPKVGRIATGVLLLAGGAAAVAINVAPASKAMTAGALAVVGASLITTVLGLEGVRSRCVVRAVLATIGLVLAAAALRT